MNASPVACWFLEDDKKKFIRFQRMDESRAVKWYVVEDVGIPGISDISYLYVPGEDIIKSLEQLLNAAILVQKNKIMEDLQRQTMQLISTFGKMKEKKNEPI
ncbi:hypothetical protein [Neomegalonema sp.]|uniref:hypothetical protein n=1 Tax=Neomegalonema sp. TaxID=2039713 RepID=UPI00262E83C4|nr:hypothetical protein [Neomegalonema sp.]MDD2869663.1 hypothetical protein [Neomegalonema sp.]